MWQVHNTVILVQCLIDEVTLIIRPEDLMVNSRSSLGSFYPDNIRVSSKIKYVPSEASEILKQKSSSLGLYFELLVLNFKQLPYTHFDFVPVAAVRMYNFVDTRLTSILYRP